MNNQTIISVSSLLGTSVHTREASSIIMQEIKDCTSDEVELDFSSVNYISRSFADQFSSDKMEISRKYSKSIIISNANEDVINMLQAVAKAQHKIQRNISKIPVYKFSSQEQLRRFLLRF